MITIDSRLLLLDPSDNVLVARARLAAGETIAVDGALLTLTAELPLGHKLAGRRIAAGEKILKYGAPIGSATADIAPGEHVHVHNMKSEYTPTHHLYDARANGGPASRKALP
ncbi:MAG: UxaA family hydrolase [Proteobacteria bacterium]|nr:UxaA family hydrolase [Pseudomonadota bacterium]